MVVKQSYIEAQTSDGIVKVAVTFSSENEIAYITLLVGRAEKKVHIGGQYLNELIDMLVDIYEMSKSNNMLLR